MEKTISYGRKKRSQPQQPIEKEDSEMTLSHEILVLDFGDESVSAMRDVNSVNGKYSKQLINIYIFTSLYKVLINLQ